jgi:hypothetical protein
MKYTAWHENDFTTDGYEGHAVGVLLLHAPHGSADLGW